jgi:hypothetical protein
MIRHGINLRHVTVIGCGGIGSWLIPPLAKHLAAMRNPPGLSLIDGDKVEEKNCVRQNFYPADVGQFKSLVFVEAISAAYPELNIEGHDEYWNGRSESQELADDHLILAGPDNHVCRANVFRHLEHMLSDSVVIVGGNEDSDGCVLCAADYDGGPDWFVALMHRHPEIFSTDDDDRAAMSCADLGNLPSGGQTMAANYMAAAIMFNYAVTALGGIVPPIETYFDTATGAVRIVAEGE